MTLGIPRLRELFMTASKSIKTPVMTMPLNLGKTRDDAEVLVNHLRRIKLAEVKNSSIALIDYHTSVISIQLVEAIMS